jgi:hypothetical protein
LVSLLVISVFICLTFFKTKQTDLILGFIIDILFYLSSVIFVVLSYR